MTSGGRLGGDEWRRAGGQCDAECAAKCRHARRCAAFAGCLRARRSVIEVAEPAGRARRHEADRDRTNTAPGRCRGGDYDASTAPERPPTPTEWSVGVCSSGSRPVVVVGWPGPHNGPWSRWSGVGRSQGEEGGDRLMKTWTAV